MALTNFQRISFLDANPWISGALAGGQIMQQPLDFQKKALANHLAQLQMPYAQRMAEANLLYKQGTGWHNYVLGNAINHLIGGNNQPPNVDAPQNFSPIQQNQQNGSPGLNLPVQNNTSSVQPLSDQQIQDAHKTFYSAQTPSNNSSDQTDYSAPQTNQNTVYGVTLPEPTHDETVRGFLHAPSSYQARRDNIKLMQAEQIKSYNAEAQQASQAAIPYITDNQMIDPLVNAYNAVPNIYKGAGFGKLDINSWLSRLRQSGDPNGVAAAQKLQAMITNIKPQNFAQIRSAIGPGSRINLPEAKLASLLNVTPTDSLEAMLAKVNNRKAINTRGSEISEYWNFRNAQPYKSPLKSVSSGLLQNYLQQFPMVDEKGNFLPYNAGHWGLYVTDKANKAYLKDGAYIPSKEDIAAYDKKNNLSKALNKKSNLLLENQPGHQAQTNASSIYNPENLTPDQARERARIMRGGK